jgi:hypothetical protein
MSFASLVFGFGQIASQPRAQNCRTVAISDDLAGTSANRSAGSQLDMGMPGSKSNMVVPQAAVKLICF